MLNLRGRDLRGAKLDRADLRRADLTGADLEGASLVGADLSNAKLQCADLREYIMSEDRRRASCTEARGANFTRAKLTGARMAGIDLRGARLAEADLEGADLSHATATGTVFNSANMDKADLTGGVQLQGASLLIASLQGADLFGAYLQGADLGSASLQGAILSHAQLQGANLRDSDLEGADLRYASLQGAEMSGAKVRAADLRGVRIWMTAPPAREALALADLTELVVQPLEEEEVTAMRAAIDRLEDARVKTLVKEAVEPTMGGPGTTNWTGTPSQQIWGSYVTIARPAASENYGRDLTDHLVALMCKQRFANGAIATGVAKRAAIASFRGNRLLVYERLRAKDCAAGDTVARPLMQRLSAAVDNARPN